MRSFLCVLISIVILTIVNAADKDKSKGKTTPEKGKKLNVNRTITDEVFLEVEIYDSDGNLDDKGKIVIGVFGDVVPMTALNFVKLAKGFTRNNREISYKNSPIHRIVKDFVIQMGDVTVHDGTGSTSIFGDKFNDENFILSHKSAGYVAMANHGTDSNGSQFFILLTKARWLDGKHVVFGKVLHGMDLVKKIGDIPSNPHTAVPDVSVKIAKSGVNKVEDKYDLTEAQAASEDDM